MPVLWGDRVAMLLGDTLHHLVLLGALSALQLAVRH